MADDLQDAVEREDLFEIAKRADQDTLDRLVAAEELIQQRRARVHRGSRIMAWGQAIASYVALAGFFANAFQNWSDKLETRTHAAAEQTRWDAEFKRAKEADRYRAFFETSTLVTDPSHDKRLVGYSLLREFVDDGAYGGKAMLLLETSLSQELRRDTAESGIDADRRAAITAIVQALGHAVDCKALEHAARSIDRVTSHHKRSGDIEEAAEVYAMFVRHVFGRAALICPSLSEFNRVRAPIRDSLVKTPALGAAKGTLSAAQATTRMAEILRDDCEEEESFNSTTDCPSIAQGYKKLCDTANDTEESGACEVVRKMASAQPAVAAH